MTEQSAGLVDSEKYTDGEPGSMSFDKLDKLTKAFLRKEHLHMARRCPCQAVGVRCHI